MNYLIFQIQKISEDNLNFKWFQERLFPHFDQIIYVTNDSDIMGLNILKSDNKYREFSAYELGFKHLQNEALKFGDTITFVNETFSSHHIIDNPFLLHYIFKMNEIAVSHDPKVIGDLDQVPADLESERYFVSTFLSTFIFTFNYSAFDRFDGFIINGEEFTDWFCSTDDLPERLVKNQYRTNFTNHLDYWLYLNGRKRKWYGHKRLSHDNIQTLRLKYLSLLLENNFSKCLLDQNIDLIDVTGDVNRRLSEKMYFRLRKYQHSIKIRFRKLIGAPVYSGYPLNN